MEGIVWVALGENIGEAEAEAVPFIQEHQAEWEARHVRNLMAFIFGEERNEGEPAPRNIYVISHCSCSEETTTQEEEIETEENDFPAAA